MSAELLEPLTQGVSEILLERGVTATVPKPYLRIPEAADLLPCKRQRIDDLLSARKLTRFKEGRRTLLLRGSWRHTLPLPRPHAGRGVDPR
jgi:hypothetical protein